MAAVAYHRGVTVDPSTLRIVYYPHPVLLRPAEEIAEITDEVKAVARRMLDLMHQVSGVGLAAPQVALPWRLFVANATGDPGDDVVFINPVLLHPGRELEDAEEGCLSLPGIRGVIRRPQSMTIRALDWEGRAIETSSDGLSARIWQHETDHLDGIMIMQRMTGVDRLANRRVLKSLESDFIET